MRGAVVAAALGASLLPGAARAQDLGHKAPPQSEPIALVNATVHTVSGGTIEGGSVLFEQGRIVEVARGPREFAPPVRRIDLAGKHVYPGLIASNTRLGLTEIGAVRATHDFDEVGAVTPEVRAAVAVNPDSTLIPVARSNGVLTAAVLPAGGAIPGRLSILGLDGWTWETMTLVDDAGLVVNWPHVRPIRSRWMDLSDEEQRRQARRRLERVRQAFDRAKAYRAARRADPSLPEDLRW
ncbi:MAG: amidohydrolase, partial [Planctomycetota bacterium]